jgi:hypothetical protein
MCIEGFDNDLSAKSAAAVTSDDAFSRIVKSGKLVVSMDSISYLVQWFGLGYARCVAMETPIGLFAISFIVLL